MGEELKLLLLISSSISTIIFAIKCQFKGILYDESMRKINPKHKSEKSFSFKNGRIWFALPLPVKNNHTEEILKLHSRTYNKNVYGFWISILVLLISNIM